METFKDIKGYEGIYQINRLGEVRRILKNGFNVLNGKIDYHGYRRVKLSVNGKYKDFKVHQLMAITFLNHTPNGMKSVVDHIDNNKLNNRLDNLQIVTTRENNSKEKNGTSKYTGVSWYKSTKKWKAQIGVNGKKISLGYFKCETAAHLSYLNARLRTSIIMFSNSENKIRKRCTI